MCVCLFSYHFYGRLSGQCDAHEGRNQGLPVGISMDVCVFVVHGTGSLALHTVGICK
jgi:hypothetical protein